MLNKVLKNTFANYALKSVQLFLNLVAIPIVINEVGKEAFGIITFAAVFIGYFNVFDLGIAQGVTKYVSQFLAEKDNEKVNQVINTSLGIFMIIGISISLIVITGINLGAVDYLKLSDNNYNEAINIFYLTAFMAIFMWPRLVLEGAFKGIQDFITLNFTVGLGRIFSISLAIIFTKYFNLSIFYIFLAFNLDKFLLCFIQYYLLSKKLPFWNFKFKDIDKKTFNLIFVFSGWIMLSQIAILLEYQLDQFILISFVGVSSVATYVIVFYLFSIIQQISGLACQAIMPFISELNVKKKDNLMNKIIYNGSRYHNMLFVPIVVFLYLFSEPFIKLWVGSDYLEYIWLIKMTIIFQLIWQSNAFMGSVYYGLGMSRKLGLIALIIGIFNILLSLILTYYIGFPGVILGTIIVGVLSVPFEYFYIFPDLKINLKKYLKNIFLNIHFPFLFILIVLSQFEVLLSMINSWLIFITTSIFTLIFLYLISYLIGMNREEKVFFKNYFKQK